MTTEMKRIIIPYHKIRTQPAFRRRSDLQLGKPALVAPGLRRQNGS